MAGAVEDFGVVGALVLVPEEERFHARAREGVLQFVGAVGGVDVDESRTRSRAAHVQHDPLNAVGGPEADTVASADAKRPETAGYAIGSVAEFGPCHALRLMARCYGKTIRIAAGGAMKKLANGEVEEGRSSPRV